MTAPKNTLSQEIAELDQRVEWFYSDQFQLESAMEQYRAALKLAQKIERELGELKNEVEILSEDFSKKQD